jgi:hypothetical protein
MTAPPPAMRIKSRWFSGGDGAPAHKSAAEQASAMAFIVWRVAVNMLKRMRAADFDVDAGAPYFAFLREVLVFLAAVADRLAYQRLASDERVQFTTALVRHVARHLQGNADDLLAPTAAGEPSHADAFIDLFNEVCAHYAEFDAEPQPAGTNTNAEAGFTPGFAFVRYLGARLEPVLPEAQRRWVLDQVMAIEAPEAVQIVQRSMRELFDPAPREARRGGRGTRLSGD